MNAISKGQVPDDAGTSSWDENKIGLVLTMDGDAEEAHEEWLVEKVLDKMTDEDGKDFYRIKWKGWSSKHNSWEPLEHLENCVKLVNAFDAKFRIKQEKRGLIEDEGGFVSCPPPKRRRRRQLHLQEPPQLNILDTIENVMIKEEVDTERETPVHKNSNLDIQVNGQCSVKDVQALQMHCEEEESEEDEINTEYQNDFFGPRFRRIWRKDEVPAAVISSCEHNGSLLHFVRLKPDSEEESLKVLKNPKLDIEKDDRNFVIIPSVHFRRSHPQLLIKYYESIFEFKN